MEEYFSIGEVSKATKIPISTLRFYDEIGVLSPAIKDERTKYRYYAGVQIPLLRIISHMRRLGFSTEHIKSHFSNKDYAYTEEIIAEIIVNTKSEIARLQSVEKELEETLKRFRSFKKIRTQLDKPFIKESTGIRGKIYEGPFLTMKEMGQQVISIEEIEAKEGIGSICITRGIKLSVESWKKDTKIKEALVNIYPDEKLNVDEIIPPGKYACSYGEGTYENSDTVPKLLSWIEEQGYKPRGEIFILFSNFSIPFKSHTDFLYTVKIPIIEEGK
jgi:DNA-binding transcriptional MerR regulator